MRVTLLLYSAVHSTYCFARKQPLLQTQTHTHTDTHSRHLRLATATGTASATATANATGSGLLSRLKTNCALGTATRRDATQQNGSAQRAQPEKSEKRLIYNVDCSSDENWAAGSSAAFINPHTHTHCYRPALSLSLSLSLSDVMLLILILHWMNWKL